MRYDVLIIGAGPAGLSAGVVLGRARRSVLLIDSGEPRNAPARQLNGYLGIEGIRPHELRYRGRQQLERYGVGCRRDRVVGAERSGDSEPTVFHIACESGQTYSARKLLFATGIRDQLPSISGLKECYGVSVHHCPYCDGWEHRDQRLCALGNKLDSARDLACLLRGWSSHVTLLTHGLRMPVEDIRRCRQLGIRWAEGHVQELVHEDGTLRQVKCADACIAADALFFASGSEPASDLPFKLGCAAKEKGHVETSPKQQTCAPGVYVAGDADGDVQFAIVAAAEGATAAMVINQELTDEDCGRTAERPGSEQ